MEEDMEKEIAMPEVPPGRGDDIHHLEHMDNADLIAFKAGNQFMVMEELMEEFKGENPSVGRVFYETLPPGLELRQILAGGAKFKDTVLPGSPDVYTSVTEEAMRELQRRSLVADYSVYLHNRIVLMVPEGNPKGLRGVDDLGRDDVKVSQPGAMEDITHYIVDMYSQAGGQALVDRVMEEKRGEGTTLLTVVHHRETPLRIMKGTADVGPVWATEVINARKEGFGVEALEVGPGLDQHDRVNYFIARLSRAPNPDNAGRFIRFIKSARAQAVYERYGFVPHR
jgi:molybdate transport system substrate-binding protein